MRANDEAQHCAGSAHTQRRIPQQEKWRTEWQNRADAQSQEAGAGDDRRALPGDALPPAERRGTDQGAGLVLTRPRARVAPGFALGADEFAGISVQSLGQISLIG